VDPSEKSLNFKLWDESHGELRPKNLEKLTEWLGSFQTFIDIIVIIIGIWGIIITPNFSSSFYSDIIFIVGLMMNLLFPV